MEAIKGLFVQVLALCRDAGMVKLGHVALDGTKMKAEQNDHDELVPMVDQIEENTGHLPDEVSVDTGYCSEDNIGALEAREIRGYIATGRQKHGTLSPTANQEKRQGTRTVAAS